MAEVYRIVWDLEARADFFEAVGFIAEQNPSVARRVAARVDHGALSLNHHPHRGRGVPELLAAPEFAYLASAIELRELVLRPWRLVYVIEPRLVRIVALVDSRRDMAAWLERNVARFDDLDLS